MKLKDYLLFMGILIFVITTPTVFFSLLNVGNTFLVWGAVGYVVAAVFIVITYVKHLSKGN